MAISQNSENQLGSSPPSSPGCRPNIAGDEKVAARNPVRLLADPAWVLREETDSWAILFHPDTGKAHGLDPVGVFVWKRLDGCHTESQILEELRAACPAAPPEASQHLAEFLADLTAKGLARPDEPSQLARNRQA